MKTSMLLTLAALPLLAQAQYMNDYQPINSPLVTSTVNLVSAVTSHPGPSRFSHHVNTVEEMAGLAPTDVWLSQADSLGNLPFSRRIGMFNVREQAAAIERCANGDFIIAATTYLQGRTIWLFRYSPFSGLVWSYRYINPASDLVAYCIRRTNETGQDNYIIAAAAGATPRLFVFKINGAGNILWNRQFNAAAGGTYSDVPKSMIITDSTLYIAGNRETNNGGVVSRDLFAIGIHRGTGAVLQPYTRLGDTTRTETDPFINRGNTATTGALVLTYGYNVLIGTTTTSRIAVMRLTNALNTVGNVYYYSETGAIRQYGHTIYANGNGFDIGGGTTVNNLPNALFLSINAAGTPLNYRRLWSANRFTSTYMLRDTFVTASRYLLHNYKQQTGQHSMSLLRNITAAAPCNDLPGIQFFTATAQRLQPAYNTTSGLTRLNYVVNDVTLPGSFFSCFGGGGVFRKNETAGYPEAAEETGGTFKLYPSLLQGNMPLTIEMTAAAGGLATVNLFGINGRQVIGHKMAVQNGLNRLLVATAALKAGMYIVEVNYNGQTARRKIIKE